VSPTQTRHRVGVDCPTCGWADDFDECLRCGHPWIYHGVRRSFFGDEVSGACEVRGCPCPDYVAPCEGHRLERVAEVEPVAGEGGL